MSKPISSDRLRTAKILLRLIGFVSLIPLLCIAYQSVVSGGAFDLYTTLPLDDWGVAVFAILLLIGVGLAVFVGKAGEVFFSPSDTLSRATADLPASGPATGGLRDRHQPMATL